MTTLAIIVAIFACSLACAHIIGRFCGGIEEAEREVEAHIETNYPDVALHDEFADVVTP